MPTEDPPKWADPSHDITADLKAHAETARLNAGHIDPANPPEIPHQPENLTSI